MWLPWQPRTCTYSIHHLVIHTCSSRRGVHKPLKRWNLLYKLWRPKCFFQFEIIIIIFVSSLRFIWIPMLWVYDHYKYCYSYSAGIDFRRHNLTSTDVRFWSLKSIPALKGLPSLGKDRPRGRGKFVIIKSTFKFAWQIIKNRIPHNSPPPPYPIARMLGSYVSLKNASYRLRVG